MRPSLSGSTAKALEVGQALLDLLFGAGEQRCGPQVGYISRYIDGLCRPV